MSSGNVKRAGMQIGGYQTDYQSRSGQLWWSKPTPPGDDGCIVHFVYPRNHNYADAVYWYPSARLAMAAANAWLGQAHEPCTPETVTLGGTYLHHVILDVRPTETSRVVVQRVVTQLEQ